MSSLDDSIAPFLSDEISKLYGQWKEPDAELIQKQVQHYYMPMYSYLKAMLEVKTKANASKGSNEPLFIGISAPQGCGKTTMTDMIKALFKKEGKTCVAISLDDFYKTGKELDALAKVSLCGDRPNELLQGLTRGRPQSIHIPC